MTRPILVADSIGKSWGARRVLTAASLESFSGEVTYIAGRNGSGKSTLLNICVGLTRPDHGTVRFEGINYLRPRLHSLASRGLFFLPDRDCLSPSYSLREHIAAITQRFKNGLTGIPLEEMAALLRLDTLLDKLSNQMSGGEKRRAELATALARQPLCLIADEPLRGIDPKDRDLILAALKRLAQTGCAVVLSGHETMDILSTCDKVVWVTAGTTYALGSPDVAERHDKFRREYLFGAW